MLSKLLDFFSTKAGKEKIETGTLSQAQLFLYFYLIIVFDYISLTQQTLSVIGRQPNFIEYLNIWQFPIVGAVGLIILFLANGGTKGSHFFSKYFVFSFTVGIKYFLLYTILEYLPTYFPPLASNTYEVLVNIMINIIMVAHFGFRIYQTKT
ncbi:hypothetical protein [Legionella anisa]|uniref:hypothetical protein n=1 Tax=Legionella anisa TaxID=28082 RepID=UPI001040F01E|nr:hypothetical protein [Legionella anisa]